MPKYVVPVTTWANASVTVETDETDPVVIARLAESAVHASLCHKCNGSDNTYLEIGDEWTAAEHDGVPVVTREDA
jgi:hypothetical protein